MSFLCATSTDTVPSTTTTTQQIPTWYEDALKRLVAGGEAEVADQPYQYYNPSARIAPLSATETQTISAMPGAAGSYMPGLGAAMSSATAGSKGIADIDFSKYMNPYTQNVVDVAKREAIRDYQTQMPQVGYAASRQGAFGGARHGVVEAEAQRNLGQRLSDIQTQGQERAFNAATGLQSAEAQRQLQAAPIFANIGSEAQRLGVGGLNAILASQALPRGLEQQLRDLTYQETQRGQGYGMQQLGQLSALLRGFPMGGTTTAQQQNIIPQQSPLSTAAGLGLAGAGIYNLMGWGK